MFSRREVRWGETNDREYQDCSVCGKNEASQCARDEAMFPEIVDCTKGVEIPEGAQRSMNVRETSHQVVRARLSFESVESLGSKKSRELCQSLQDQQGLKPSSRSETAGAVLKCQIVCHRCGQFGHIRSQCPGRQERSCFTCGEFDHFMRNCPQNVSQPQSQGAARQPTISVSTTPGNIESQRRKRQRESSQLSSNQINLGPPTLPGNQRVSQLDKLCYVCRKPGHFARNCPRGSGVPEGSSSLKPYKRTPNQQ